MKKPRRADPTRVAERQVLEAVLAAVLASSEQRGSDPEYLTREVMRAGASYLRTLFRARGRIRAARRKGART